MIALALVLAVAGEDLLLLVDEVGGADRFLRGFRARRKLPIFVSLSEKFLCRKVEIARADYRDVRFSGVGTFDFVRNDFEKFFGFRKLNARRFFGDGGAFAERVERLARGVDGQQENFGVVCAFVENPREVGGGKT